MDVINNIVECYQPQITGEILNEKCFKLKKNVLDTYLVFHPFSLISYFQHFREEYYQIYLETCPMMQFIVFAQLTATSKFSQELIKQFCELLLNPVTALIDLVDLSSAAELQVLLLFVEKRRSEDD